MTDLKSRDTQPEDRQAQDKTSESFDNGFEDQSLALGLSPADYRSASQTDSKRIAQSAAANALPDFALDAGKPEVRQTSEGSQVEVDDRGKVTKITYSDGQSRSYAYDDKGNLKQVTEPDGQVWTKEPGSKDEWRCATGAHSWITRHGQVEVGGDGQLTWKETNGTVRSYDAAGKEDCSWTKDDGSKLHRHDGKVDKIEYKDGTTRSFNYDANGQLTKVWERDGSSYRKNSAGDWEHYPREVGIYDHEGRNLAAPPERDRVISGKIEVATDGTITTSTSDGTTYKEGTDGRTKRTNSDGSVVDADNGRVTKVTYKDGSARDFHYNEQGNLLWIQEPGGGRFIKNTAGGFDYYDSRNPAGKPCDAPPSVAADGTFTYTDETGKEHRISTNGREVEVTKDSEGRVIEKADGRVQRVTDADGRSRTFEYDKNGEATKITWEDGTKWMKIDGLWLARKADGSWETDPRRKPDEVKVHPGGAIEYVDEDKTKYTVMPEGACVVELPKVTTDDLYRFYKEHQDEFDKDGDGFVTRAELAEKAGDPKFRAKDAVLLDALMKHVSDLEELSNDETGDENDGITLADMEKLWRLNWEEKSEDEDGIVAKINGDMAKFAGTVAETISVSNRDLYAHKDNPAKDICPEAIRQGDVGDCYFMSALASLAATNPDAIARMIKDNGDGTYTVTFPGARNEPITVKAPSDYELAHYAHGSKHGTWAAILEKAYGEYCQESVSRRSVKNLGGGDTPQEATDGGSVASDGLKILTGTLSDTDVLDFTSNDELDTDLKEAIEKGRPITCKTVKGKDGLTESHEYSVIGYDPVTKTVKVRDPKGNSDFKGAKDGVIEMSLDQFRYYYNQVNYGGRTK